MGSKWRFALSIPGKFVNKVRFFEVAVNVAAIIAAMLTLVPLFFS